MKLFLSIVFSLSLFLGHANTASAQIYTYLSQDPAGAVSSYPHVTYTLEQLYTGDRRPIKWRTDITNSSAVYQEAFDRWDTAWGATQSIESQEITGSNNNGWDVNIVEWSSCSPNAYGCVTFESWSQNWSRKTIMPKRIRIHHPGWDDQSDGERKSTATHEIGHILGLAHNFEGTNCGTNPISVMGRQGCNNRWHLPTYTDNDNLRNYMRMCDGVYSWCGKFDPEPNSNQYNASAWMEGGKLKSWWKNHAWHSYVTTMRYYTSSSYNGTYSLTKSTYHYDYTGFWEGAVTGSDKTITVVMDNAAQELGSNRYVRVCAQPWAYDKEINGTYYGNNGISTCANSIVWTGN